MLIVFAYSVSNNFRESENQDNYKTHLNNFFRGREIEVTIYSVILVLFF